MVSVSIPMRYQCRRDKGETEGCLSSVPGSGIVSEGGGTAL